MLPSVRTMPIETKNANNTSSNMMTDSQQPAGMLLLSAAFWWKVSTTCFANGGGGEAMLGNPKRIGCQSVNRNSNLTRAQRGISALAKFPAATAKNAA